MKIKKPEKWNLVIEYTKKDRNGFDKIRTLRPSQTEVLEAMNEFINNIKFENCISNDSYIKALGLKP